MVNFWNLSSSVSPTLLGLGIVLAAILFIVIAILKGMSLWYAARRGEKVWFIVLLIINTMGILELIYLFAVAKWGKAVPSTPKSSEPQQPYSPNQM